MILRKIVPLLFVISLPLLGWSQGIIQVGIPHTNAPLPGTQKSKNTSGARTNAALSLPFWEDFSSTKTTFVNPAKWLYGRSVRVNDGMAIKAPSLKVASFDGVDSTGSPYSVTDVLAKGYADKLVSQDIDLSTIDAAERNTVWMSYMFQMKGNGELPDAGDRLLVLFFDSNREWIPVDTIDNDGTIEPDIFYISNVQISDDKYFHPEFKFRIQNFGRLSGPFDAWHVDYIYINKGRVPTDNKFGWFPDRTISEPPTSIFGVYRSIPVDHFLLKANELVTQPGLTVTNLNKIQIRNPPGSLLGGQPITAYTTARIGYRVGKDDVVNYSSYGPTKSIDAPSGLAYDEFYTFSIDAIPDLAALANDLNTQEIVPDSIGIYLELGVDSGDNKIPDENNQGGDFDPIVFPGIDFRSNDTIRTTFSLQNKYAYDDGTAEYGAGLNQPGAQVAYRYDLVGVKEENITFLEMYFPRFGDESSQVLELRIWDDLEHDPIYTEVTTLQRSQDNVFWLKQLTQPVHVDSIFYIGWKQSVAAVIAVGLDKNTDTGDRMFSNTSNRWDSTKFIHGSLMMRPVFGEGAGVNNGLEDEKQLAVYPNPSSGTFYFDGVAETISVYDMTGRSIPAMTETTSKETKIILNASQGIYIIRAQVDGRVMTSKVMIR